VGAYFFSSLNYYFLHYQRRIGTKSAFEFHNDRSMQISVILSNLKKKIIWNYFMSTYISNFHQYILKKNYILQIFNLHFIFNFCFSQLKKEQYILFFLIILIPMTDCTCTSKWSIFYYLLSRIETTRSHGTRLILTPGKMYS
jgi:hypothetical protein